MTNNVFKLILNQGTMRKNKSLYDSGLIKFDSISGEISCTAKINALNFEVGSWKSEVGSRKSEVGSRKTEVGSRKSEVRSPSSAFVLYGYGVLLGGPPELRYQYIILYMYSFIKNNPSGF